MVVSILSVQPPSIVATMTTTLEEWWSNAMDAWWPEGVSHNGLRRGNVE